MAKSPPRLATRPDLYELATVAFIIFWGAIILGAVFDLYGTEWLIATAAVLAVGLAAKTATNLVLKRRTRRR